MAAARQKGACCPNGCGVCSTGCSWVYSSCAAVGLFGKAALFLLLAALLSDAVGIAKRAPQAVETGHLGRATACHHGLFRGEC